MNQIYVHSDYLLSALGFGSEENIQALKQGRGGISLLKNSPLYPESMPVAQVDIERLQREFSTIGRAEDYTAFEQMILWSLHSASQETTIQLSSPDTLILLSSTKGNIHLLDQNINSAFEAERVHLWRSAQVVQKFFKNPNPVQVVSNACISGVSALVTAYRFLKAGLYRNVAVVGGDVLSKFVISGFQAFKAVSQEPCKPYDQERSGITLGEAAGAIILSTVPNERPKLLAGASSNDANHISGPSRTGEGLYLAIQSTLQESGLKAEDIHAISAHGTATAYNDEMEAQAFYRCGLHQTPLYSLKGYWGHTLGAAGLIESIAAIHGLEQNVIFGTLGFKQHGVSHELKVNASLREEELTACLKTASGFGGGNAAILFAK
jgi:3-oxoacyl-[acyl-carrier-protein] synthase I